MRKPEKYGETGRISRDDRENFPLMGKLLAAGQISMVSYWLWFRFRPCLRHDFLSSFFFLSLVSLTSPPPIEWLGKQQRNAVPKIQFKFSTKKNFKCRKVRRVWIAALIFNSLVIYHLAFLHTYIYIYNTFFLYISYIYFGFFFVFYLNISILSQAQAHYTYAPLAPHFHLWPGA